MDPLSPKVAPLESYTVPKVTGHYLFKQVI
jgi:hypothetical protein